MDVINHTDYIVEALPLKGPGNKSVVTIIIKGTFSYRSGICKLAEEQIPVFYGDEYYDEITPGSIRFESDLAPFKPNTDVILNGNAYSDDNELIHAMNVRLKVGPYIDKTIAVIGNREWKYNGRFTSDVPGKPGSFSRMPIIYENSFGGIDKKNGGYCEKNFCGKGYISKRTKESVEGCSMPNLEDSDSRIESWKDHPDPVGFGVYARGWQPRLGYMGTFDETWQKEQSPDLPNDFDFRFYNSAHPDLQITEYLKGDEDIEMINLSSKKEYIRFKLPEMNPKCTIQKSFTHIEQGRDEETKTVQLNMDSLYLLPEEQQLFIVWRGMEQINDFDLLEIKEILIEPSWK